MAHPSASAFHALQLLEPRAPSTKFPHLASFFNLVLPNIPFSAHFGLLTGTHLWSPWETNMVTALGDTAGVGAAIHGLHPGHTCAFHR